MEISYAFFAKAAQFSDDGLGILGGDIHALTGTLPFTPDALTLVVRIEFAAQETGRREGGMRHLLLLETFKPDGQKLREEPFEIALPPRDQAPTGGIVFFDLSDTTFPVGGTYRFQLLIDGKLMTTRELEIKAVAERATA